MGEREIEKALKLTAAWQALKHSLTFFTLFWVAHNAIIQPSKHLTIPTRIKRRLTVKSRVSVRSGQNGASTFLSLCFVWHAQIQYGWFCHSQVYSTQSISGRTGRQFFHRPPDGDLVPWMLQTEELMKDVVWAKTWYMRKRLNGSVDCEADLLL